MAALTADAQLRLASMADPMFVHIPVKASTRIFQGSFVGRDNTTGYAIPWNKDIGGVDGGAAYFAGTAEEGANNTSATDGAVTVLVRRITEFVSEEAIGSYTRANVGSVVQCATDNPRDLVTTGGVTIGEVSYYDEAEAKFHVIVKAAELRSATFP